MYPKNKRPFSRLPSLPARSVVEERKVVNEPVYTLFGWRMVPDGEVALVTYSDGSWYTVEGPQFEFCLNRSFQILDKIVASPDEYLEINYVNGDVENKKGPCNFVLNPFQHTKVTLKKKLKVNSGYAIVVYSKSKTDNNKVNQLVVNGPVSYTPQVNEWAEKFNWKQPDQNNPNLLRTLIFRKLRTVPDQMRINVPGVRTADDR
eukprot:UN05388